MEKKYARLAALLAAAVLCGNGAPSMAAGWWVGDGNETIKITAGNASEINGVVYGNKDNPTTDAVTGHVEMTGGNVKGDIYGGWADDTADVKDSTVTITSGSTVEDSVYGGYNQNGSGEVSGNTVRITGGKVGDDVFHDAVYGGCSYRGAATYNTVAISGGEVTVDVYGGWSDENSAAHNTVAITGGEVTEEVYGGYSNKGAATGNTVTITGGEVAWNVWGGYSESNSKVSGNTVTITGGTVSDAYGAAVYGGESNGGAVTGNPVTITGDSVVGEVCGGFSNGGGEVSGNTVTITGGGTVEDSVFGGSSNGDTDVTGNTVALLGSADVSEASLYGRNDASTGSGNTLLIDGWSGRTEAVKNFDTIRFQGVTWDPGGTLLTITTGENGDLGNTKIDAGYVVILGGRTPQVGESMTFVTSGNVDTGLSEEQAAGGFTQGVATAGTAEWDMTEDRKTLNYTITGVFRNAQTDAVAENRLAGAAFVNQGADIAADSLRLLDDGYHYGMQTFGAVYGNRSQYDVNSDIKINGWSEIAGFGNIHEVKGGRLAWGVFYENGTGNYRTWNTFNNEMFRGDGSLLYNGGGAAIRLTKDSGMYYEASLRAGTLSSSMSNAVKDGNGNSYGFDSDSTYWGAHVGAGKLIQRGSGQWDIYGKYFHTDIDGDSFEMGGDRFSFDSVTSDRLRLGARYTADTDKAWSLYCGAAYEYEFSGGSHMKAGQFDAPEQSLQGSTVFGEIGTVWGRKDSPWSMDVNLRGYAGEREGFSGMVQLAYAF